MKIFVLWVALGVLVSAHAGADARKIKQKAGETYDATAEYAHDTKEEFQTKMQKNLDSINAELKRLKEKAAKVSDETGKKIDEEVQTLETKKADVEKSLTDLKKSSGNAWKDLRDGIAASWNDLKTSAKKAASKFEK